MPCQSWLSSFQVGDMCFISNILLSVQPMKLPVTPCLYFFFFFFLAKMIPNQLHSLDHEKKKKQKAKETKQDKRHKQNATKTQNRNIKIRNRKKKQLPLLDVLSASISYQAGKKENHMTRADHETPSIWYKCFAFLVTVPCSEDGLIMNPILDLS